MDTPLLTNSQVSDPKVLRSLDKLGKLAPFTVPFDSLKESLKDYLMGPDVPISKSWELDWFYEQAIMTYLFGQGHA